MEQLSWIAIVLAAASSFLLGGLWYSPMLFLHPWLRATGQVYVPKKGHHPARAFALSFLFALIAAAAFAWLLGPYPELVVALRTGAIIGIAFVATSFGINYQFADRPFTMTLIDGGYHTAQFLLYGLILGLWKW
jgi:hypothetical protein